MSLAYNQNYRVAAKVDASPRLWYDRNILVDIRYVRGTKYSTYTVQYSTVHIVTQDLGQYKEQTFEDRLNGSEADQLTGERQKKEMRCREKMGRGKELRLDGLEDGQETEKAKGENRENSGKIRH